MTHAHCKPGCRLVSRDVICREKQGLETKLRVSLICSTHSFGNQSEN